MPSPARHHLPVLRAVLVAALAVLAPCAPAAPPPLAFVVHGVATTSARTPSLRPLADYLAHAAGVHIVLRVSASALAQWRSLHAAAQPPLVFEAAQFTGWGVLRRGYHVLAGAATAASYTVAIRAGTTLAEADDLAGREVACPPAPALPALQLAQLVDDPLRAPRMLSAPDPFAAAALLRGGRVWAAVVPTRLLAAMPDLHAALTLEELPGPAVSAASSVPPALAQRLRRALLAARADAAGRRALRAAGLAAFRAATDEDYLPAARLLRGTWGY